VTVDRLDQLKHDQAARGGWLDPRDITWLILEVERLRSENAFALKVVRRLEAASPEEGFRLWRGDVIEEDGSPSWAASPEPTA